jgi:glucokinase
MKWVLLLDVGGSSIKTAVSALSGKDRQVIERETFEAKAYSDKESILRNFLFIFETLVYAIPDPDKEITGIALAFPGDFDYERGIPLLCNVGGKYAAIYDCVLPELFRRSIATSPIRTYFPPEYQVLFLHDIAAFLLGAIECLPELYKRVMALCIGTGAGSAFYAEGKLVDHNYPGVPYKGWLYDTPYRESIIDDYLSIRGLARLSEEVTGAARTGRELSDLAQAGNERALQIFSRFGDMLGECMLPFFHTFAPECFILGGQITKSAAFFTTPLRSLCASYETKLYTETQSTLVAMKGLLRYCV